MTQIAIGTLNKAKSQALREVVAEVWKDATFLEAEVPSGVSSQPLSDEEGIQGAMSRARHALKKFPEADLGAGLEGSVAENKYGMFLGGWVAIIDRKGKIGIGASGRVQLPESIRQRIKQGEELGPLIQKKFNDEKNQIRHSTGTIGILTKDLCTRVDQFKTAVKCALAPFLSPDLY